MKREALVLIALTWAPAFLLPLGSVEAGPVADHAFLDPQRVGPAAGGNGVSAPLSFLGYDGDFQVFEGTLPIHSAPVKPRLKLMQHPSGAGVLIYQNPKDGTQQAFGFDAPNAVAPTGPQSRARITMPIGDPDLTRIGTTPDGNELWAVIVDGKVVAILVIDPKTGRILRSLQP